MIKREKTYNVNNEDELKTLMANFNADIEEDNIEFPNEFFYDGRDLFTVDYYLECCPEEAIFFKPFEEIYADEIQETETNYHNADGNLKVTAVNGDIYSGNDVEDLDKIFRYNNLHGDCDCTQDGADQLNISKCFVGCKHMESDADGFVCNKHCKWIAPLDVNGDWIGAI